MDGAQPCFVRGQGRLSGVKEVAVQGKKLAAMQLVRGSKHGPLTDVAEKVLIQPDQMVLVPEERLLEVQSSVMPDESGGSLCPVSLVEHQTKVVPLECAPTDASRRMQPWEFTRLDIQPEELLSMGKVLPSSEVPILVQEGSDEVWNQSFVPDDNADLRNREVLHLGCWPVRTQPEGVPRKSRKDHRGQTRQVASQFRRHQLGSEFSPGKRIFPGQGQVREESEGRTIAEWPDPTEMIGGCFLWEVARKPTHGCYRVGSSSTGVLRISQGRGRGYAEIAFKVISSSEPMLGLPDLNQPQYLSGLQFLVMEDEVANTSLVTQGRSGPRPAMEQVRELAMTDRVDEQRVDGISRRLVQGCWLDDGVVYAGRCRLNLPTGKSRREPEEDKSQITQWAQHCGRNQMRTLSNRVCYQSGRTGKLAFVKSGLGFPLDKVDGWSGVGMLQLRPTPERPCSSVSLDVQSGFPKESGSAAGLVEGESPTNLTQLEAQVERANAGHVATASVMCWLELLGAVQSCLDVQRCSAGGSQSFEPRGVAPQVRGDGWSATLGFADEEQALDEDVADARAELKQLKLVSQNWWKIRRCTGIFEVERYILHLTFWVSFWRPFHADLIYPGRARLRRAPPTVRRQFGEEVENALVHRQDGRNATDKQTKHRKQWKGEPSKETGSELESGVWHGGSKIEKYGVGLSPPMRTSGLIGGGELLRP